MTTRFRLRTHRSSSSLRQAVSRSLLLRLATVALSCGILSSAVNAQDEPAAEVEKLLRRLPGEAGPLPVAEAMKRFKTPDDLLLEPVLSEPEIGQPLFIELPMDENRRGSTRYES